VLVRLRAELFGFSQLSEISNAAQIANKKLIRPKFVHFILTSRQSLHNERKNNIS